MKLREDNCLEQQIGEYLIVSPEMPARSKFLNGEVKKKADQKFQYTPVPNPAVWEKMSPDEQEQFENQEWDRRINGLWFFNNGQPTWITGIHYYFLNYYYIKGTKPEYRDADRTFFWVWDYCVKHPRCEGLLFITRRQQGKCLGRGTKVRMFDGSLRNVEDIAIGDQVMGIDSTARNVIATYSGIDEMYEVVQNRGMSYSVNSEHLVSLRRNKSTYCSEIVNGERRFYQAYPQYGAVANIPAKELINKSAKFFSQFSGYSVGYELPEMPVRIEPYFLGVWLGDGNTDRPGVTSADPEIVSHIYKVAETYGLNVNVNENKRRTCATYMITGDSSSFKESPIQKDFRSYNLFGNKHIPKEYLQNSREVRLKVLAGLIDSDGYTNVGCYQISQKSEQLTDDIKELATGLGFRCVKRVIKKQLKSRNFEGTYFKLTIIGKVDEIPVKLERKKCVLKAVKDKSLTKINEIKRLGHGEYFGFTIDGDHLYLLEDGTVTHNTFKGGCIALEYATRTANRHIGIQSKTEDDAEVLFQRAIVESWQKLPQYFSPKFSNSNEPKKEIRFAARSKGGKGSERNGGGVYQEAGLNTWIDYENSRENAYDGDPLMGFFLNDEIFKDQQYNPVKRWSIVRKIFKQQGKVIAKSFHTSSVGEEIEAKGVERARQLWDDSNPNKLLKNGQTKSGLFRLFQPAFIGYMWDEYGLDMVEQSKNEFQSARDGYTQDNENEKLLGEKRANPFTVDEALLPEEGGGVYNQIVLSDTIDQINAYLNLHGKAVSQRYKLRWADEAKTTVVAIPDPKGRFDFSWFPPDTSMLNRVQHIGQINTKFGLQTRYAPLNSLNFGIGIDPVDHRSVKDEVRASMFSANGFWKYDPINEANMHLESYWPSGSFIFRYAQRVHNEQMYEDLVMACHMLGCSMLFENQKPGIETYFINRGYESFLAGWEGSEKNGKYGIAASPGTIGKYVEITERYIEGGVPGAPESLAADWRRCPFPEIINQWIQFDPKNTKKYDEAVSASYTLMHCNRYMPVAQPAENVEDFYASDLIY